MDSESAGPCRFVFSFLHVCIFPAICPITVRWTFYSNRCSQLSVSSPRYSVASSPNASTPLVPWASIAIRTMLPCNGPPWLISVSSRLSTLLTKFAVVALDTYSELNFQFMHSFFVCCVNASPSTFARPCCSIVPTVVHASNISINALSTTRIMLARLWLCHQCASQRHQVGKQFWFLSVHYPCASLCASTAPGLDSCECSSSGGIDTLAAVAQQVKWFSHPRT